MPGPFRFAPPVLGAGAQTRPRLLRALLGRFSHRCTVIVAGAGHGKTTLLAQALRENRLAPRGDDIWLTVEAADSDASHLAHGLLRALGEERSDATAASIADAVWRRAPTEVCLMLDDVHVLSGGSTGAELVASLLESLPANGHLVVASRAPPALPLARLAAASTLIELEGDSLRFDEDELVTFAAERGVDVTQLSRAGGWPALAELLATTRGDRAGDFLWEEVLEPLGSRERRLLAVLCELGGGDDRLLSAAIGEPVRFTAPVPLVSVDAGGWRVPHDLWRAAAGLALPAPQRLDVRRGAARDLIARSRLDAAFDLLAEVDLWEEVPSLLHAACRSGEQPRVGQLRRWLARCPDEVRRSPEGELAAGVLAALTTPELASGTLRAAIEHFRASGDVDTELNAMSHLGHVAWWLGDVAVLAELLPRIAELEAEGNAVATAFAAIGRALVCSIQGDDAGVLASLADVPPGVLDPRWDAVIGWLRGGALGGLGDGEGYVAALESALPAADPVFRATVSASLVTLEWARGHIDSIVSEADELMSVVEETGIDQHIAPFAAASARACAFMGALEPARTHLARAHAAEGHLAPAAMVQIALADAAVAVASGDEDRAVARLRAALAEHPLAGGRTKVAWRSAVALVYVFAPEQRPELDSLDGPAGVVWARSLARAVLAGREEGHADPIDTVDVRCPNRVRAALPVPLVVELAVRLHGAGRVTDALSLLEPLGDAGRARLRGLGTPAAKSMLAAVPAAPVVPLQVRALGALRVDGRTLDRVRVRELLGFLLLHRSTTRTAVTVALWPDLDDRAAANNLRVTLSHLLRVLEPERADGEAAYSLRVAGPDLRLVAGRALDVDLDAFDAHIAAAAEAERDGTLSIALERYAAAADLFEGELLADLPDVAWADIERERCRARFVAAAVRAGELLTAAGELDRAERLARRALEVDEWSEPAYAVLTSTALARGDRSAAHRLLERCQEMLRELGVEPSMATGQLARRVRSA